jgi:hypothetical protein
LVLTQTKGILILNGYDILNNNVLNVEDLKLSMVLLIYQICERIIMNTNGHLLRLIIIMRHLVMKPKKINRIQSGENTSQ